MYRHHFGGAEDGLRGPFRRRSARPAPRYRDYIAWLAEQDEGAARAYWRTALQETTARPLPRHALTDQAPPELSSLELTVTDETPAALRRFARDHDLTIGTLIVAAWSLVLGAATGTDDTLFGLTVSGRPAELPDVGDTVGCFINNVPLRVTLDADAALVPWLQTLQENQLNLQPFEYASPAQIQAWSGQRSSGPLFDTLVVLQAPVPHAAPGGLTVEYVRGGMQTGYPLSLGVVPGANSIELELSYDRRRVSDRFVEQMASALQRALRAVPVDGSARLASLRAAVQMDGPLAPSGPAVETRGGDWEQPYTLPRTAAEQAMAQIWAEVLNLPRVGTEDNFFDVGGDSVRAIQLFTQIEERLGKSLPVSLLFNEPTVAHMAQALGDDVAGLDVDPILQPINPNGTRPPLFYVHGIFGDVLSITNLVPFLGADQPLYGLQAAGLSPGFEPDVTIEAMAARYVESIRRIQASGPYYLGGFCFGGVVAYEIARQLEHRGEETALLAIIEGMAPREFHNTRPVYHPQRLEILRQGTPYWARGNKEFGGWRLKERILSLMGRGSDASPNTNGRNGGALNDNLADFNAARPASQFALREINKRAVEEYVPPPYGGRVTLFRARCVHIKDALLGDVDPERGWGSVAQGGVSIVYVDGTHIGMLMEPHVAGLAATLARVLREAQERVQAAEK